MLVPLEVRRGKQAGTSLCPTVAKSRKDKQRRADRRRDMERGSGDQGEERGVERGEDWRGVEEEANVNCPRVI